MSEKHNGWANYNTWLIYTWMNNDEDSQKFFTEMVKDAYTMAEEQQYFTKEEEAIIILAEDLKYHFVDNYEIEDVNGIYHDLLMSALSDVDWHEIASHSMKDMELTA